jgi:hypothetical protein
MLLGVLYIDTHNDTSTALHTVTITIPRPVKQFIKLVQKRVIRKKDKIMVIFSDQNFPKKRFPEFFRLL